MPRPPRKEFAGALYHVTSRGNGRARIFFDDADRQRFWEQLQYCLTNYQVVLYAYVLMPNHYHLLVRTMRPNLSRFMQRLNTSYALYSRYKHRQPGHRLEGRYKAKVVQGDEYIMTLTRYLHLNPVKVKAAQKMTPAERRTMLSEYRWSSYRGYVDVRRQEECVCYDILKTLDDDRDQARRRYRGYVTACLESRDEPLLETLEKSGYGIGDEGYVRDLESDLRKKRRGDRMDDDVAYPVERIAVATIEKVVAEQYGTTVDGLKRNGHARDAGLAKMAVMEMACRLTDMTQRAVGARYGGISSQAVSGARRRLRAEMAAEELANLATNIRAAC